MKTDVYNQEGKKVGTVELPEEKFGLKWNGELVHQVVVSMQANARAGTAHAKGRGEVSGGGRKPWRQKGTGRARHGSTRSPIWVGGGVTHGPNKAKSYKQKINQKMKRKAALVILTQKAKDQELKLVEEIKLSAPKTALAQKFVKALKLPGSFVVYTPAKDENLKRSFRNLPKVKVDETRNANPLDLLKYRHILIVNPQESLKQL